MPRKRTSADSAGQGFGLGCGLVLGIAAAATALTLIPVFLCCGGFGLLGLGGAALSTGRATPRVTAPALPDKVVTPPTRR